VCVGVQAGGRTSERRRAGVGVRVHGQAGRCRRAGGCVRTCACPSVRAYAWVCVCACVRARAWVDSSHPFIYQPPTERMSVRMCVYVHEAIFSRFKGLSPFVWYQRTTYGSYALRIAPKCLSVPPLVGCGGGLWGWVVCVGVVCSPLPCTWGRVRGCGDTLGGVGVPMRPCEGMRAYMHTCVHAHSCA